MGIGMTFSEFTELRSGEEGFPLSLNLAVEHLRARGYDCRPAMLTLLAEDGTLTNTEPDAWTPSDMDAAAEHFERCEIFTPYAAMCQTLGCRYADFVRPLQNAAGKASQLYGQPIPACDQYFEMHRIPPRCSTDEAGCMTGTQPSVISFTLCDDIRERLERGEEV